ncbi:MAG: 1-deoxy-D-xylulose-5-phosphate reductoisomerase [Bacteroidetes bacterium HGW-Bacteroidetes-21]|jgi:1-deoxy-D-xylulose-5-phosphate reductoisomerase|nr:MAG: 1-deoxy-D-xylulose-5-phosphate reductoisomerase [Bacteroidetes bacterium HGW-Bacteroidetes-21]
MEKTPKRIAILGSTGSIGTQALDIISGQPEGTFEIEVLTAHSNVQLLVQQARQFNPNFVVTTDENNYEELSKALSDLPIKVFAGMKSVSDAICSDDVDIVLAAMVGFAGLVPVIDAIKAGKSIALANKETLVVAGEIISKLAIEHRVSFIPVDSEHSAIFQCVLGENISPIDKIFLTASGGPFLGKTKAELENVKLSDALKHPTWCMGNKVTIDSATLMNKGLEMIEARWLFGVAPEQIQVVVHPQSIVHSMVSFCDGSVKAQISIPDMRLPILYALTFPARHETSLPKYNPTAMPALTFAEPDRETFPCLDIAYEALRQGGNMPCIMNAANEIAVQAFLDGKISFNAIPEIIRKTMETSVFIKDITLENLIQTNNLARETALSVINN